MGSYLSAEQVPIRFFNFKWPIISLFAIKINYLTFIAVALYLQTVTGAPIADKSEKFLGNITQGSSVPANFKEYWNQITPENAGKWGTVEYTQDRMNWSGLDAAYKYAKDNDLLFKQHTFVWGNQAPRWITSLSADKQREEVEEWIKAYGERYPETDMIDVVNEPINTLVSYSEALGGKGETGCDWIVWAFEKAREYCPNAKLLINEFDVVNNESMVTAYLDIIKILQERDLIDGIGVQSHFFSIQYYYDTIEPPTVEELGNNLDRLAGAGLPIYPSELDIYGEFDEIQLDWYQRTFPVFWEHPAVAGVTIWGWIEDKTWAPNTHLISGSTERSALTWLRDYINGDITGLGQPAVSEPLSGQPFSIYRTTSGLALRQEFGPQTLSPDIVDLFGRTVIRCGRVFGNGTTRIPPPSGGIAPGTYIGKARGKTGSSGFNFTVAK